MHIHILSVPHEWPLQKQTKGSQDGREKVESRSPHPTQSNILINRNFAVAHPQSDYLSTDSRSNWNLLPRPLALQMAVKFDLAVKAEGTNHFRQNKKKKLQENFSVFKYEKKNSTYGTMSGYI